MCDQEIDHRAQGNLRCGIEIGVERDRDHVRWRLGHRPCQRHIVARRKAKRADKARLDCGDAHLAIALRAMAIAA